MNNRTRKQFLFAKLGKRCVRCGATTNLSFDHIHPRSYSLEHLSESRRLEQYLRDMTQGLLQVLCIRCNSRKSRVANNKGFRSQFVCKCVRCEGKKILKNNNFRNKNSNSTGAVLGLKNETRAGRENALVRPDFFAGARNDFE